MLPALVKQLKKHAQAVHEDVATPCPYQDCDDFDETDKVDRDLQIHLINKHTEGLGSIPPLVPQEMGLLCQNCGLITYCSQNMSVSQSIRKPSSTSILTVNHPGPHLRGT
jgi:hypothetical protein